MICAGAIVPWRRISRRTVCSVIPPGSWWPRIGTPLIGGDVDRVARAVVRDVARARVVAVAALERGDAWAPGPTRRGRPGRPARAGRSARSARRHGRSRRGRCARRTAPAARAAAWAAAGSGRSTSLRPCPRRRARCVPRRGRSRWPRAASSRRGSAWGRSAGAPRPAGRIEKSTCAARPATVWPTRPITVPPMTREPSLSGPQPNLRRVEAEGAGEVVLVGLEATLLAGPRVEHLLEPAGLTGAGHLGMREEPLLDRSRRTGVVRRLRAGAGRPGVTLGVLRLAAGGGGRAGLGVVLAVGPERHAPGGCCRRHRPWAPGRTPRPRPGGRRCSGCRTRPGG